MTELKHTKALDQALKGRDDVMLEPILRVLLRHIGDPRFGQICCDVATVLLGEQAVISSPKILI
jgi:U3 small nucleolar RNA-associated protein 15